MTVYVQQELRRLRDCPRRVRRVAVPQQAEIGDGLEIVEVRAREHEEVGEHLVGVPVDREVGKTVEDIERSPSRLFDHAVDARDEALEAVFRSKLVDLRSEIAWEKRLVLREPEVDRVFAPSVSPPRSTAPQRPRSPRSRPPARRCCHRAERPSAIRPARATRRHARIHWLHVGPPGEDWRAHPGGPMSGSPSRKRRKNYTPARASVSSVNAIGRSASIRLRRKRFLVFANRGGSAIAQLLPTPDGATFDSGGSSHQGTSQMGSDDAHGEHRSRHLSRSPRCWRPPRSCPASRTPPRFRSRHRGCCFMISCRRASVYSNVHESRLAFCCISSAEVATPPAFAALPGP